MWTPQPTSLSGSSAGADLPAARLELRRGKLVLVRKREMVILVFDLFSPRNEAKQEGVGRVV